MIEEASGKHDKALVFNITRMTDIIANCKLRLLNKKVATKLSVISFFFRSGIQILYDFTCSYVIINNKYTDDIN